MNQFYNANFIIFSTIVAINSNEDNAFDDDDDDSEIEINTDNNNYELVNPESEDDENENKNKFSIQDSIYQYPTFSDRDDSKKALK